MVGTISFSFESIFVFFMILFLSAVIAKVVSFLSSDNKVQTSSEKGTGLGSWLLLIRIGIITAGIIVAFISVGIPMDKVTIIISALGVGIGFGLQTLVNNLVSGLIIAFEKPVNLNDIIEINGQTGKMKSIGIRASVVTTWDGADVIIPNGDLLSHHLVNWTMGSTRRRFELQVGVAYGTDLALVKLLIKEVLCSTKMILKNPEPMIWVTNFGDSSIDFSIKYWVGNFTYGNDVRSDLIMSINEIFAQNNIVIPFPQRDIHIQPGGQVLNETEKPE
jgi:small-conductance mechanosensitive channel